MEDNGGTQRHIGPSVHVCLSVLPANTCQSLPPISNVISGAISVGARTEYHFNGSTLHITAAGYGDIVEFRCQDKPFPAGYVPRDGLRVDCLENGTWSSHSPSCNRGEILCRIVQEKFDSKKLY